jgi:hypothetical protein
METPRRMPLHDLPLEQFLTTGIVTGSKTQRKHKRPLSPSRSTPLNPAKRRVLDAEGIPPSNNVPLSSPSHPVPFMLSNIHTVTPTRPSRLGNGYNSLLDSYTLKLIVALGSFEVMGVPKELRLLCRRTNVRLAGKLTLSRRSNRRSTRSPGIILVSISFETANIAGALRPQE